MPFVTPTELDADGPIEETPRTLTDKGAGFLNTVPPGSVMVCCIGSLGKVGFAARELATNQQINSVVFDRKTIYPRYGYYACRRLKPLLEQLAPATTVPIISKSKFQELKIPLPPLEEQKRIAAILDQADSLRRLRQRAIDRLNSLGQAIFYEMFGSRERWLAQYEKVPLSLFCRPKQWKTIPSSEMEEHGYLVYGANGKIGFYREYNHEQVTVLITCRGATCGTINVCDPFSYVTGNAMALDDLDNTNVGLRYLEWALRVRGVDDAITGSAQPQITRQTLACVEIPLPPKHEQELFERRLGGIDLLSSQSSRSYLYLANLFSCVQHRSFRGEL
ncbi:MAG: restriction endonuclease subunit S [Thiocapsa sp. C3-sup]|uniref:restriction endonuclease subunit S n=1 Tax=unclassified Thiocapsa TaxID=2641286 RepID=UPI0035AD98E3